MPMGKLTFPIGAQVEYLPLTVVNHTINEADKTIQITLSQRALSDGCISAMAGGGSVPTTFLFVVRI